jgi:ferric-dicitrate binding protein FerR (iron transport regulator)
MISTGFKSGAVVAIGNSTLSVQPLSRLSVEELVLMERGEKVGVNLRAGRIRAEVKPPAGGKTEFTIRSPSVTASVRGTAFEFDGVELRVEEGRVHVAGGDGGGIYVGAGHAVKTDIESGLTAGVAQAAREELTPPAPAGAGAAEAPASAVLAGDIDAGFEWK